MGSACPKPASFSHVLMIFDRNSPLSWRHCPRYCMERPVVDPHMVYSTFVHQPSPYEFSIPTTMVANTLVFHFEQLYGHRALTSGSCGSPAIIENPNECFFNFCFHDLSHIQSFLMAEFNVSATYVVAKSKELLAAQERISTAAARGGFNSADEVASKELFSTVQYLAKELSAAQERMSTAAARVGLNTAPPPASASFIPPPSPLSSTAHPATLTPPPTKHLSFSSDDLHHSYLISLSVASVVVLVIILARKIVTWRSRFMIKV
jgi:hypothetical protein